MIGWKENIWEKEFDIEGLKEWLKERVIPIGMEMVLNFMKETLIPIF